jgi:hypothetical protein
MRAKRTADGKTSSKFEKTLPGISTFTQFIYTLFEYRFVHWQPSRATLTKLNRLIKFCRLLHRHFGGVDVVVGLVLDPNIDTHTIYTCVYNNAYTNLLLVIVLGVAAMRFAPSNMGRHFARPP